ncbi:g7077 [Coccomyxa viridis]|uniref:G7077 protein n=1 Tax=Coccomyxa viridis TaxID=1274662 RepID=A0ABP1FY48_9CHLO
MWAHHRWSHAVAAVVAFVLISFAKPGLAKKNKTVHIVFSNHLDIGFDGISPLIGSDDNVVNVYFNSYFPKAIAVDDILRKRGGKERLKYLSHSWLISLFMDCPPNMGFTCPSDTAKKAVENAIREGIIYWHAFPYNGQLELMDERHVRECVQLTHDLDAKYGYKPKITLSQRDVPGMTRNAIPILVDEGVQAITIGVNGGSAPPGVPKNTPFIWRDKPSGKEIMTVVHPGGYSGDPIDSRDECVQVEGFSEVLCMAWRMDNQGPHSVEEVINLFNITARNFPDADIQVSTLDAYFELLIAEAPNLKLPVVTGEIGDTWIYGVASDAVKVAEYRSILRLRSSMLQAGSWNGLEDEAAYKNFSRILSKIPEHTWGLDVKTFLADYSNWSNKEFQDQLDAGAWNYRRTLDAWDRQRHYNQWALEALGNTSEARQLLQARDEIRSARAPEPGLNWERLRPSDDLNFTSNSWSIALDRKTGGLGRLQKLSDGQAGNQWASADKALGRFLYSTYTEKDYDVIWDNYMYISQDNWWVEYDFGKKNCSEAGPRRADVPGRLEDVWVERGNGTFHVYARCSMPRWAVREAGAPEEVWLDIRSDADSDVLNYDVIWVNKTATRLPEAAWVQFAPDVDITDFSTWQMYKLGRPISPLEVVSNGSYSQHAVSDEGISVTGAGQHASEELNIRSLDAALVSPGFPSPFPNVRHMPDLAEGMSFNLANNIWGTNYIMWQPYSGVGDTMRFRFEISSKQQSSSRLGQLIGRASGLPSAVAAS